MTTMLKFREQIKRLYGSYSILIEPVIKFALAAGVFFWIRSEINYVEILGNPFVLVILALICSLFPVNGIYIAGIFLFIGQSFGVGVEAGVFTLALLFVMYAFFLRFAPKDGVVFFIMPLGLTFKVPCLVPLGCGLTRGYSTAAPAGCGVVLYYYMELLAKTAPQIHGAEKSMMLHNLKMLIQGLLENQEMIINLTGVVIVTIIVNLIRKMQVEHAWTIGIGMGTVSYLFIRIMGKVFLHTKESMGVFIAGTALSFAAALLIEFFMFHMDYSKTESMQYEDDDYYYYVKAVPKIKYQDTETEKEYNPEEGKTSYLGEEIVESPVSQDTVILKDIDKAMSDIPEDTGAPVQKPGDFDMTGINLESKLEESLKEL